MPEITFNINEEEHHQLSDAYKKMTIEWLRDHSDTLPPPFEQWAAMRLMTAAQQDAMTRPEVEELQAIHAIEKLVTSLQRHGFGLALLHGQEKLPDASAELAETVATELGLPHTSVKRIQELLGYYAKSAKEVADRAHVLVTNRAYSALHEVYRELIERTMKARAHLGEDKALGRVEGGAAILVGMHVMTREAAKQKTEAFRQQARDVEK